MSKKLTIRGKVYDLDDVSDVVSIQSALVPENWPIKKADAVRLFLSLQNMLALEFKRHLAANFKGIVKSAIEQGDEPGGTASTAVSFAFEINVTAPQVAAINKTKMSFSVRHSTEGKPKTHDLNQGEFLNDDLGVVLDVKSLAEEAKQETPPTPEESQTPPGGEAAPKIDKPKKTRRSATA